MRCWYVCLWIRKSFFYYHLLKLVIFLRENNSSYKNNKVIENNDRNELNRTGKKISSNWAKQIFVFVNWLCAFTFFLKFFVCSKYMRKLMGNYFDFRETHVIISFHTNKMVQCFSTKIDFLRTRVKLREL